MPLGNKQGRKKTHTRTPASRYRNGDNYEVADRQGAFSEVLAVQGQLLVPLQRKGFLDLCLGVGTRGRSPSSL